MSIPIVEHNPHINHCAYSMETLRASDGSDLSTMLLQDKPGAS